MTEFALTIMDIFDLVVEEICGIQDETGQPLRITLIDRIIDNWTPPWDTNGELRRAVWAYINDPENRL